MFAIFAPSDVYDIVLCHVSMFKSSIHDVSTVSLFGFVIFLCFREFSLSGVRM